VFSAGAPVSASGARTSGSVRPASRPPLPSVSAAAPLAAALPPPAFSGSLSAEGTQRAPRDVPAPAPPGGTRNRNRAPRPRVPPFPSTPAPDLRGRTAQGEPALAGSGHGRPTSGGPVDAGVNGTRQPHRTRAVRRTRLPPRLGAGGGWRGPERAGEGWRGLERAGEGWAGAGRGLEWLLSTEGRERPGNGRSPAKGRLLVGRTELERAVGRVELQGLISQRALLVPRGRRTRPRGSGFDGSG
jgi:hypothetical protein